MDNTNAAAGDPTPESFVNVERVATLIAVFEEKAATHPVFSKMWILFLEKKLLAFDLLAKKCEELLAQDMTGVPDINPQLLRLLLAQQPV